jgi:hypothetical protein
MKKILAVLCLGVALCFSACATTGTTTPSDVNQTITTTLTTIGTALSKVPVTMDNLYASNLVTKDQYNQVSDMYMKAKSAYIMAVDAHEMNLMLGTADAQNKYDAAYQNLLTLNADLQQLLISFTGGK